MRSDIITPTESTFESAQKDLFKIIQKLISNENLKKLLYYPVKDALEQPELTTEETVGLLHRNIRVIPKLPVDEEIQAYIIVSFDAFTPNEKNPQFRDNLITFDVICNMDCWSMNDYQLRPYLIMGEIDGMMNKAKLNGIGKVDYISANQLLLSEDLAGFSVMYRVINDV